MTKFLRTYGRAIIAVLVAIFSGLFGEADPTAFQGFLENLLANGEVTVTTVCALIAHYLGERKLKIFDPPPKDEAASGAANLLLVLMLPAGLATHAITPADLIGPTEQGDAVVEVLSDQTDTPGDVSLLKHRPLYEPAPA